MAAAGRNLKPCALELGGKSANIVHESADFERALDGALLGIYSNNGQQCLAGARILVQRSIAERFMRTLKEQCLYLHQFASLEEARRIIGEFIARYNTEWLIERLGYRTPAQARAEASAKAA